jgi:hypothetical protein
MSSSQDTTLEAKMTEILEHRAISAALIDNSTDYILNNQSRRFIEELHEQQAIVQSLNNNTTNMSADTIMDDDINSLTDNFINEINEQKVNTTVSLNTSTMIATSSDTTSKTRVPSTYTLLSHLQTQTIMETRKESLINRRGKVWLAEAATESFNPITTLNMHFPNDLDPFSNWPLPPERLQ